MEILISLLVQIISGAVGGNLAGMTKQSLGTGLNTFIGGVGGLILGQILALFTGTSSGEALDVAAVGSNIVGGGDDIDSDEILGWWWLWGIKVA